MATGLYVGPFQPSTKREILKNLGVTHILCIAETREAQVGTTHTRGSPYLADSSLTRTVIF